MSLLFHFTFSFHKRKIPSQISGGASTAPHSSGVNEWTHGLDPVRKLVLQEQFVVLTIIFHIVCPGGF